MEILDKDFVEFIECCTARDVKFLIDRSVRSRLGSSRTTIS